MAVQGSITLPNAKVMVVFGVDGEVVSFQHVAEVTYVRNTGKKLFVKGRLLYLHRLKLF